MTDLNSPAWLQETSAAPPASVVGTEAPGVLGASTSTTPSLTTSAAGASTATAAAASGVGSGAAAAAAADADDADLPGVILIMRLANMGVAAVMIVCSVLLMITIPPLSGFVLAIYATCGSILICCLETQLKFLRVVIALNFGFLFNSVWRFLFYVLMGSVGWSYNNLFGKIVGIAFVGVALFNTYVLCRYPAYRKIREKIAEEEDKRIEARISKEVKRQAAQSILSRGRG